MATIDQFNTAIDAVLERIARLNPILDAFEARVKNADKQQVLLERTQKKLDDAFDALTVAATTIDTTVTTVEETTPPVDPNAIQ